MDTDSLIMNIKTKNLYKDIINNNTHYDLSEYAEYHPMNNMIKKYCEKNNLDFNKFKNQNKKVIGKMKDEIGSGIMDECVALRSKLYNYQKIDFKDN